MRFRVWAPHAQRSVDLVFAGDRSLPMEAVGDGNWEVEHDAGPATRYAFSLDGGPPLADPRALRLPEGPEGPAEVVDLDDFTWTDTAWRGTPLPGAVIYEMHVGTFTAAGTLDAAIDRLDHLVELGVDLVEIMPVATFPGRYGWVTTASACSRSTSRTAARTPCVGLSTPATPAISGCAWTSSTTIWGRAATT